MTDSHKIDKLVGYIADDPIYQIHEFNIDLKTNHIYLTGIHDYIISNFEDPTEEPGIEYAMTSRFVKNLNILMRKSNDPILIHMKTSGGDWQEGMAVYDTIKACPNRVTILNYSHARSMSSIIFQAADKRVMMPNSIFMFHEGSFSFEGTTKQFRSAHQEDVRARKIMLDIYTEAMKESGCMSSKTKPQIRRWLTDQMDRKEDVFMSAEQTVEYGFADEIFGQDGHYDWKKLVED